mgnify:FL=1
MSWKWTTGEKREISEESRALYAEVEPTDDPLLLCEVRVYLGEYQTAVRMLDLARREQKARASADGVTYYGEVGATPEVWIARMHDVENFIRSLPHMPCKMLLYYHYIYGDTVERTAEDLDISRRHAFRLKKRALGLAAACYPIWRAHHPYPTE